MATDYQRINLAELDFGPEDDHCEHIESAAATAPNGHRLILERQLRLEATPGLYSWVITVTDLDQKSITVMERDRKNRLEHYFQPNWRDVTDRWARKNRDAIQRRTWGSKPLVFACDA